jgi:hypothetical protein
MAKEEAANLARAKGIAEGKERNRKRGYELDDDDFDDEYGVSKRRGEPKPRIENLTTAQLRTFSFHSPANYT